MQKSTGILSAVVCFLAGIIVGFFIAPIKKGIYCGNYNGNQFGETKNNENDYEECYDEDAIPF